MGEMVRDGRPWAIIFASLHNKKDEKSLYSGTKKCYHAEKEESLYESTNGEDVRTNGEG